MGETETKMFEVEGKIKEMRQAVNNERGVKWWAHGDKATEEFWNKKQLAAPWSAPLPYGAQ